MRHLSHVQHNYGPGPVPELIELLRLSDQVHYLAILCLIYRAAPQASSAPNSVRAPASLSPECIDAARKALQAHLEGSNKYKGKNNELWNVYIHWAILNAPFTPFIVLFCHVVTTYDVNDLLLLSGFTQSLHNPASNAHPNSEGAERMHKLCRVFYQVAKLYVEAKARESESQSSQRRENRPNLSTVGLADVGGHQMTMSEPDAFQWQAQEFNPYLNALGFMPGLEFTEPASGNVAYCNNSADAPNNPTWSSESMDYNSTVGIQDWFSGNQSIMGLLEQDLDFDQW